MHQREMIGAEWCVEAFDVQQRRDLLKTLESPTLHAMLKSKLLRNCHYCFNLSAVTRTEIFFFTLCLSKVESDSFFVYPTFYRGRRRKGTTVPTEALSHDSAEGWWRRKCGYSTGLATIWLRLVRKNKQTETA